VGGSGPQLSIVVATGAREGIGRLAAHLPAAGQGIGDVQVVEHPVVEDDVGRCWNRAAERATGEILLFIRGDARPAANLATDHLAAHRAQAAALVLGELGAVCAEGVPRAGEFCGQTLSLRRTDFLTSGGFMEGLPWGAEAELALRLGGLGFSLVRLANPVGEGDPPRGVLELAAERAKAGKGSVELYRRVPGILPEVELAEFRDESPRALLLRRLLLAVGGPIWPAALLQRLIPAGEQRVRWRRFVRSYFFWRGVWQAIPDRDARRRLVHPPVILMYHAIGGSSESASCYITGVHRFAAQMAWLKWAGYRVIGLDSLMEFRRRHKFPPARSVVITFDDGYADNHDLALPVLLRRRFPATFFLVSDCVGTVNRWDSAGELAGRTLLSWDQVRAMLDAGMEVGGHSRRHHALPDLGDVALASEVAGCREDLERCLGRPVRAFAYPYGRVNGAVCRAVEAAGFGGACCSQAGVCEPRVPDLLLRRVEVRGTDSLIRFARGIRRGGIVRPGPRMA
jgi:peptidoglycan/xylan/chitin deacetylase (PgdA/CDA1 family)